MSHEFREFLKRWGVSHRVSSVDYPQSNGRAELAVKSSKRIIRDNTQPNGSLDNDRTARAILQHRNTPMADIGMSPAQLLLHREIRDHIPVNPKHYRLHKNWVIAAEKREELYAQRDENLETSYSKSAHTLQPLTTQTAVTIQMSGKWDKSGRIVQVLPHRQYRIRVDGSGRLTLRNRRFLRTAPSHTAGPTPTPSTVSARPPASSALPPVSSAPPQASSALTPVSSAPPQASSTPPTVGSAPTPVGSAPTPVGSATPPETPVSASGQACTGNTRAPEKLPKALRELLDHNEPGTAIQEYCGPGRTRSGRL
jgi:hypothetical protein